jgi:hypothetical protein
MTRGIQGPITRKAVMGTDGWRVDWPKGPIQPSEKIHQTQISFWLNCPSLPEKKREKKLIYFQINPITSNGVHDCLK